MIVSECITYAVIYETLTDPLYSQVSIERLYRTAPIENNMA